MNQFLKDYWLPLLLALALLTLALWLVLRGSAPAPPLSPAAETAVRATIGRDQAQVGTDTARAKVATASAATSYEAGSAYANLGKVLHQQSKPHAKPTPTDTAAERLQRILANY